MIGGNAYKVIVSGFLRIRSVVIFLFLLTFLPSQIVAQQNANAILNGVYTKQQKAKDYSVDVRIKVDMPFIRMLPVDAKIYSKQKDKFKVVSKSIAIVPRQGFDQASKMLSDTNSITTMIQGKEMLGASQAFIINIIPITDTSDLILAKLWIDEKESVILKSALTTKSSGTILTDYTYGAQKAYGLPDKLLFTVDIKKFKIPKSVAADINNEAKEEDKSKEKKKGQILITLTNYQINKGIPDSVFKK